MKRQLDNFDRYASTGNLVATPPLGGATSLLHQAVSTSAGSAGNSPLANSRTDLSMFDKDFECSVCLEDNATSRQDFSVPERSRDVRICARIIRKCPPVPPAGFRCPDRPVWCETFPWKNWPGLTSNEWIPLSASTWPRRRLPSPLWRPEVGGHRPRPVPRPPVPWKRRGRSPGPPRTRRESSSGSDLMNLNPTRTQPQSLVNLCCSERKH